MGFLGPAYKYRSNANSQSSKMLSQNGISLVNKCQNRLHKLSLDAKLSYLIGCFHDIALMLYILYFLRKLIAFDVNEKILVLFYRSIIESILRYGITVWFGNLSVQSK